MHTRPPRPPPPRGRRPPALPRNWPITTVLRPYLPFCQLPGLLVTGAGMCHDGSVAPQRLTTANCVWLLLAQSRRHVWANSTVMLQPWTLMGHFFQRFRVRRRPDRFHALRRAPPLHSPCQKFGNTDYFLKIPAKAKMSCSMKHGRQPSNQLRGAQDAAAHACSTGLSTGHHLMPMKAL